MNIYEVLFLIQLFAVFAILLLEIYNVLTVGGLFNFQIAIILFIGYFILFSIGLVVSTTYLTVVSSDSKIILLSSLLRFESWFIILHVIFFIIQLIYILKFIAVHPKEAYKSIDTR